MIMILFLGRSPLDAQVNRSILKAGSFSENLSVITNDFRNNFYRIQGEQLPSQADLDTYRSQVTVPGAKQCIIYRFHSKEDTTASWQGLMYSGDNYPEAVRVYRSTCRLVNRCPVSIQGSTAAVFTGKIDEPSNNIGFVTSTFKLKTRDESFNRFYAEIELVNLSFDLWEVRLNLLNKNDDSEKEGE